MNRKTLVSPRHPYTSTTNSLYGFNFASVVTRCSGSLIARAISNRSNGSLGSGGCSDRPDGGVALLPCEFIQRLILREGQQPAIADPLGGGLIGERFGGLSKVGFCLPGLGREFHARIFEPSVVDSPGFAQRERLFSHHRIISE